MCDAQRCDVRRNVGRVVDGALSSPDFWLKAKVHCATDGVPTQVDYRQYRDADAYTAAYDPVSLLKDADDDDPTCPGGYEAAWKVGDQDVGRVACTQQSDESHITWTYDPQSIVAEAFTLHQTSMAATWAWWQTSAGPVEQ